MRLMSNFMRLVILLTNNLISVYFMGNQKGDSMKSLCGHCGKSFEKTVPWKMYCSQQCKHLAWAIRKVNKNKKIEQKNAL